MSCHSTYRKQQIQRFSCAAALGVLAFCLGIADLACGTSDLTLSQIISAILEQNDSAAGLILLQIRLPMTLCAASVGASLGLAGLLIQTITANPLASPSTLGITSGASFGAALSITLGFNIAGELWAGTVISAFAVALLISAVILSLGRIKGMTPTTIVLSGIVMNFFFMSLEQLLVYLASPEVGQLINGWTFGNLERSSFLASSVALAALALGACTVIPHVWDLTALTMGEERALSLGVAVTRLRFLAFSVSALLIAAAVSFIGTIAFIGLVSPHCARMMLGDDQRYLFPGTIFIGMGFMLCASIIAKIISTGAMLPVGIVTSMVGAPFLFVLLLKTRQTM